MTLAPMDVKPAPCSAKAFGAEQFNAWHMIRQLTDALSDLSTNGRPSIATPLFGAAIWQIFGVIRPDGVQ